MQRTSLSWFTIQKSGDYVVRKSQSRIIMDMSHISSDEFIDVCRENDNHKFIRNRKLPLKDLILSMINRKGLSLTLELRNFMKITHPGIDISKPGYLKQRMKLNPEAFRELYHFHNKNFYNDSNYKTYKNYLILAADGSNINVPRTDENLEMFGTSSRHDSKPQPAIGLGCIYDVLNKFILESECGRGKFNELACAESQLQEIHNTIGNIPYIIIMDRGYPSLPGFIHMQDNNIPYIFRVKECDFKEERKHMKTDDDVVDIVITKSRLRHYLGSEDGSRMQELGKIEVRIVNIKTDSGIRETLFTNLPTDKFDTESLKELYCMRWGIETAFETLKSRLQLENFTGTKQVIILQDIYSTIYVSNIAEDIILEAEQELDLNDVKHSKHRMKINQSLSIGILKNDLIYILIEEDNQKKNVLFQSLYDEIRKNLVPVRPDRHYKRSKGQLAGRYSNTYKKLY